MQECFVIVVYINIVKESALCEYKLVSVGRAVREVNSN